MRIALADDLRQWIATKLKAVRSEPFRIGVAISAQLPASTPLLNVPTGLVRILDRDLKAANILKRDDRGHVVDVHALRYTFASHLSKGGVMPRTAQAAMRHGSLDMTMQHYTDPRLLDVAGAMDVLPSLPLDEPPKRESAKATGTDAGSLVRTLVPIPGNGRTQEANADKTADSADSYRLAVSGGNNSGSERLSSDVRMTGLGFEPRTSGLKGRCSTN